MKVLGKLKWRPRVPPEEWRAVYEGLYERRLYSKDPVYTEIKRIFKVEQRNFGRKKDPRYLERMAAVKAATEQGEGGEVELLKKALAVTEV